MSSVSGCSGTGNINTIDTSKNEYTITMTISNCGGFNGFYSGLAITDDTYFTDDTFISVLDNDSLDTWALTNAIKQ